MTTGSYIRNLRTSVAGRYSGPYTVGDYQTKNFSGGNYPSGKPLRTNTYTPGQVRYRFSTLKGVKLVRRSKVHYVWKKLPSEPKVPLDAFPLRRTPSPHLKSKLKKLKPRSKRESRRIAFVRAAKSAPGTLFGSPVKGYYKVPVVKTRVVKVKTREKILESYTTRPRKVYSRLPKRARLAEHAYTCSWLNQTDGVVNYTYSGVGNFSNNTMANIAGLTVTQGWSSNDDLKLIDKIRTRVAGSDFNAAVMLAELNQTLGMIANAAIRINKGIMALQKGNWVEASIQLAGHNSRMKGARGSPPKRIIQDRWLELQYGWKPLLNDVYGGAQFLSHQLNVPIQQTLKVSRVVGGKVSWTAGNWFLSNSEVYTRKSIKAVIYEKDPIQLSGLTDPASILWEKMPYSFVVDWFIPIGSYLQARGLSQALTGTFVTSTLVRERHHGYGRKDPAPIINISYSGLGAHTSLERGSFSRSISNTLFVPKPSWKPLGKAASWMHCANAVALLTSTDFKKR